MGVAEASSSERDAQSNGPREHDLVARVGPF